jgi:hypothetical protein
MGKTRLEVLGDGVLEIPLPHGNTLGTLVPLIRVILNYVQGIKI